MEGYHITLHKKAYPHGYDFFKDISGLVIVKHANGLVKKEQPHYHIWLPWDAISDDDRRKKNKLVCGPYREKIWEWLDGKEGQKIDRAKWNQAYFVLIEHSSFENWLLYTIDPDKADVKEPDLVVWNRSDLPPDVRKGFTAKSLIYSETDGVVRPPPPVKLKVKEPSKLDKFAKFVIEYYTLNSDKDILRVKVMKLLFEWSQGGINKYKVAEFVNHAMYMAIKSKGDCVKPFRSVVLAEWAHLF